MLTLMCVFVFYVYLFILGVSINYFFSPVHLVFETVAQQLHATIAAAAAAASVICRVPACLPQSTMVSVHPHNRVDGPFFLAAYLPATRSFFVRCREGAAYRVGPGRRIW